MCSRDVMKGLAIAACLSLFFSVSVIGQQKKWDGGGGDSLYTNPANWQDDIVPLTTDSILLDNSIVSSSYVVLLPAGTTGISFAFLKILPSSSSSISFLIPKLNTAIPALNCSGGIVLEDKAILQNSSGAASGNAITITDSLYILNGASYIHNTDIGHASLITRLSSRPGTENGTVEFNVPGTSSYTLSVSNRIYGNLILNATASGGVRTYISTGVNPLQIKGSFTINTGATYSLNFSGDFSIQNSLKVNGIFNISTGANNNSIRIKGDCTVDGTITESGTGFPVLVFDGNTSQRMAIRGQINNSVTIRTNNAAGIILSAPLIIHHKLEMLAGKINTTDTTLLTISSSGSIVADSTQAAIFINGPLRKQGIAGDGFLFPVGAGSMQRWLRLREAVGDYTVSFYRASANNISNQLDTSLHHVSNLEYWKLQANANQFAKLEVSFNDVNSGGVTELTSLRVAQSQGVEWKSAGATGFTGSAGASGSVISDTVQFDQSGIYYFSLGSATASQNPLPVRTAQLNIDEKIDALHFKWRISPINEYKQVELQESTDGISFRLVSVFGKGESLFTYKKPVFVGFRYFRLAVIWNDGTRSFSAIEVCSERNTSLQLRYLSPTIGHDLVQVTVMADKPQKLELWIVDLQGNIIHKYLFFIEIGAQKISLPIGHLRAGQYQIFGLSSGLYTKPLRFIKS